MLHLKLSEIGSYNWRKAITGMRNAKESWDRMDSSFVYAQINDRDLPTLGPNDLKLAKSLAIAGSEHRKYLRQIFVSAVVDAPWYWWKEYETYQIGTTENSTSQMHKLGSRLLTKDDFTIDEWDESFEYLLLCINSKIRNYQKDPTNKEVWRSLIQIIPGSFIYKRTISLNYEVLANQYRQRKNHKLIEWHEYLDQMIAALPYPELFTLEEKTNKCLVQCVICHTDFEKPSNPNDNWYLDKVYDKTYWVCTNCINTRPDIPKLIREKILSLLNI
jgi:hypothetical protein